jgi:hypothetical protein
MAVTAARPPWFRLLTPWRMIGWGFALALLLTPAIAMQISHEWNWGPGDFLVAALLIGSVGLGVEWGVRRSSDPAFRIGAAMALVGAFLLAWINAVAHLVAGRDHPANLLVLMIPLAGLALGWKARWRPVGLTRVLLVMTAAQLLLAACVAAMSSIKHAVVLVVFTTPWLVSAFLFRRAATVERRNSA